MMRDSAEIVGLMDFSDPLPETIGHRVIKRIYYSISYIDDMTSIVVIASLGHKMLL